MASRCWAATCRIIGFALLKAPLERRFTLANLIPCCIPDNLPHSCLRVVSVGVGVYPEPKITVWNKMYWAKKYLLSVQLLQKTLEINTQSMDQLRVILFKDVPTVRISDTFEQPEMATDLFEHNLDKLNILRQRGRESFAKNEAILREFLV